MTLPLIGRVCDGFRAAQGACEFTSVGEGMADNRAVRRDEGPGARTWVKCRAIGRAFQGVKTCRKPGQ